MTLVNIKVVKRCAICKYWYDPTNSAIRPKVPNMNLWEYDGNCKKKCLKRNCNMSASAFCKDFEGKLEIL